MRATRELSRSAGKEFAMAVTYTFSAGTTAVASQVNQNFTDNNTLIVNHATAAGLTDHDVTSTYTELNYCDGTILGTVVASKIIAVDANKDIGTFRNVTLSGNLVSGSTTISETELGYLDGQTAGTAVASKVLLLDASKGIATITSATITALTTSGITLGGTAITSTAAELNKLDNTSAKVTATNLNTLVAGTTSDADALHIHQQGLTLISAQTASTSASIDFTSFIDDTKYVSYKIIIISATPVTTNSNLYMRVSADNGSSWNSGSYKFITVGADFNGTARSYSSANSDTIDLSNAGIISGTAQHNFFTLDTGDLSTAAVQKVFFFKSMFYSGTLSADVMVTGSAGTPNIAINGIRFYMSSGNIAAGKFYLYGMQKA